MELMGSGGGGQGRQTGKYTNMGTSGGVRDKRHSTRGDGTGMLGKGEDEEGYPKQRAQLVQRP